MRHTRNAVIALLLCACAALVESPLLLAGDFGASARVYGGTTDTEDGEQDVLSQEYSLRFMQPLTPWLKVFVGFQKSLYELSDEADLDYELRTREPLVQLIYTRDTFSGMVGFQDRKTTWSGGGGEFESSSVFGQFSWRPSWGPRYSLRVRDAKNEADVAVFGQELDSLDVNFDASYSARTWSARYSFQGLHLKNDLTEYTLDLQRHMLRGTYVDNFFDDRLQLSLDGMYSWDRQEEEAGEGSGLAEPQHIQDVLFGVDTTPELGELESAPSLGVATLDQPKPLTIQIGGANIYRNVGVDLGFRQPISRLEVSVDKPSDAALIWRVYHSPDNLNWKVIPGEVSSYDRALKRYTIRFPETTDRYFKAVNLTANSQQIVAVTTIRAFVDTDRMEHHERKSTTRRGYLFARFHPWERVTGSASVGYNEDSGTAEGLPLRDTRRLNYDLNFGIALTDTLSGQLRAMLTDDRRDETPRRNSQGERYAASLLYKPLPTVDGEFLVSRRVEKEDSALQRRVDQVSTRAITELYPDLSVTSEVSYSRVHDPFADFDLSGWSWREHMDSRPTEQWTLSGGFSQSWYDSTGSVSLSRLLAAFVRTDWQITPYVSCGGDWTYGKENRGRTMTQRYTVSWSPGTRLSISGSYLVSTSSDNEDTNGLALNLYYQINSNLQIFASYSKSGFHQPSSGDDFTDYAAENGLPQTSEESHVTSAQVGLTLAF